MTDEDMTYVTESRLVKIVCKMRIYIFLQRPSLREIHKPKPPGISCYKYQFCVARTIYLETYSNNYSHHSRMGYEQD